MFQTGGLIVFCGLLAQTKALLEGLPLSLGPAVPLTQSLPLNPVLPSIPTDLAGSLTSALTNGLLSGDLLGILKNLPLLDILKAGGENSVGLVGGLLGRVASVVPLLNNLIEVTVTDPQLLELDLVQTPDGHRLYVTIPLGLVLNVKMPLIRSLLRMDVKLNITAELLTAKDEQGKTHLILGDCIHFPDSLKISLLDGNAPLLIQSLVDSLTGILDNVLPELVHGKVCPLVSGILGSLDVTLLYDITHKLIHGLKFVIKV